MIYVRFAPESGHFQHWRLCPLMTQSGHSKGMVGGAFHPHSHGFHPAVMVRSQPAANVRQRSEVHLGNVGV